MASDADKLLAQRLFVQQGKSPEQIAGEPECSASVRTLYNWRAKYDWDAKRAEWLHEIATQAAESEQVLQASVALADDIMSAREVLAEFSRIARGDVRRIARWGADGVTFRPSWDLTDADAAAIESVGESVNQHGRALKLKLHSKQAALEALAKHYGLLAPAPAAPAHEGALDADEDARPRRLVVVDPGDARAGVAPVPGEADG